MRAICHAFIHYVQGADLRAVQPSRRRKGAYITSKRPHVASTLSSIVPTSKVKPAHSSYARPSLATGPDVDNEDGDHVIETIEVPLDIIKVRRVSEAKRPCWPGSFVSHPVAFPKATKNGVDVWTYGVVSGYTSSDTEDILHIVSSDEPTRHPLTDLQSVINVDPLAYALQPGGGTNSTTLNPLELLHQQDALLSACRRRKNDIPAAVMTGLSIPFSPIAS